MQTDMNALNQLNLRPSTVPNPSKQNLANSLKPAMLPNGKKTGAEARRAQSGRSATSSRHASKARGHNEEAQRQVTAQRDHVACTQARRENAGEQADEGSCMERRPVLRFSETYDSVAKANTKAHKAAQHVVAKLEDGQKKQCIAPVDHQIQGAAVDSQVLDAPIMLDAPTLEVVEELAAKLGIESVEGLMEMFTAKEPSPELVEAVQQVSLADFDAAQLEGIDAEGNVITAQQKLKQEAWVMIRQSLTVVTQTFELGSASQVENMEPANLDEHVIRQFSEILYALKTISGLLERAASENVALDVQGEVIEPEKAVEVDKTVRFEVFRLQLAFRMLGVAGEVNDQAAELQNLPVYKGIPQAAELAAVSQSSVQIRQLFANLIDSTEEQIRTVLARIVSLAKLDEPEIQGKIMTSQLNLASMPQEWKPVEIASFDTLVMRAILKIDTAQTQGAVVSQNTPVEIPKESSPVAFTATLNSAVYRQTIEQVMQVQPADSQDALPDAMAQRAVFQPQAGDMGARMSTLSQYRTWEESVMMQMTERLTQAVKNGVHEIRLQLRPESLGEIHLKIQVEGDVVAARINVESQQVRQIVETNLQSLRNALAEHNLQAGDFDVNVGRGFGGRENQPSGEGKGRQVASVDKAGEAESDQSDTNVEVAVGSETGRRFGDNTIEYFA